MLTGRQDFLLHCRQGNGYTAGTAAAHGKQETIICFDTVAAEAEQEHASPSVHLQAKRSFRQGAEQTLEDLQERLQVSSVLSELLDQVTEGSLGERCRGA